MGGGLACGKRWVRAAQFTLYCFTAPRMRPAAADAANRTY